MVSFSRYKTVFKRIFGYTWTNIARNKLLSLSTCIVVILIVFFINILSSINYLANYSIESINKKIDLTLELQESVSFDSPEITKLQAELTTIGVTVLQVSKEQALQDFKQILPDLGNFLETYRQNPLPASLYVTTKSLEDYNKVSSIVGKEEYRKSINFDQNDNSFVSQQQRISKVVNIASTSQWFILLLQALFFLIAIIIIVNTIKIVVHDRREEINIMQLVGASKSFIALPFILEGVLYGIAGVIIGLLLYVIALNAVYFNVNLLLPGLYIQSFIESLWKYYNATIILIVSKQLLMFVLIGVCGSLLALSPFLYKINNLFGFFKKQKRS